MKPYFSDEWAAIYHGDCLEVLSWLVGMPSPALFSAVVTDPPYCSGAFTEAGRGRANGQGLRSETIRDQGWFIGDNMGTAGLAFLLRAVAVASGRLLVDGGSLMLFADWRMVSTVAPAIESAGLRWQNMLCWDKGSPGLGTGFRPQFETILHYVRGVGRFYSQSYGNVIRTGRKHWADRLHQTEKPVGVITPLIETCSLPGGRILDPFMGSGSTLVAARALSRFCVGIEQSEEYCELAARRLSQGVLALQQEAKESAPEAPASV